MQIPEFIEKDVPLARYSTLGVGGPTAYFAKIDVDSNYPARSVSVNDQLLEACEFARDNCLEVSVLGRGSNVLFGDAGFPGLVLRMQANGIEFSRGGLLVGSGLLVSTLVSLGKTVGLGGFEFLAGLPGTIGGAIYGNAGCYGGEFWDVIEEVIFFDGEYVQTQRRHSSMFGYRWSIFKEKPGCIILGANLKVGLKGKKVIAGEVRRVREKRLASQPKAKSAGCIFKNPPGGNSRISAGRLIDSASLKGTRVGDAVISHEQGNFFVNLGGAKAGELIELMKIAQAGVYENFGVLLDEEIIKVGEF